MVVEKHEYIFGTLPFSRSALLFASYRIRAMFIGEKLNLYIYKKKYLIEIKLSVRQIGIFQMLTLKDKKFISDLRLTSTKLCENYLLFLFLFLFLFN